MSQLHRRLRTSVPRRRRSLLTVVAAISLVAAACGGAGESASGGVASVNDLSVDGVAATEDTSEGEETAPALAADEAALEFSQCMRDEGLDFPDVGVDADGNPDIRSAFAESEVQPGSEEFRTAMDTCAEILGGAGFGGGGRAALADDPTVQDALVAFTECLRDEGLDVGDIQLGAPGAGAGDGGGATDGGERGQGAARGGFADRNARFADLLGLDVDDPTVEAAIDTCSPLLDEALTGVGRPGAGRGPAGG